MAGVALLGSPRSFMAKSSNFSGLGRKTVVTPLRLVTYNRPAAITTEPQPSPPSRHPARPPASPAVEPLGPPDVSGPAFHTLRGPWSGVDDEDMSINDHARANPLGLSLQPQPVGSGHVAGPAQLETNRRSISPSRERDADSGGDQGRRIDQS